MVNKARNKGLQLPPTAFTEVRYEELHDDCEATLTRILDWLHLPADEHVVRTAVDNQRFDKQKQSGGTSLVKRNRREPEGFFRKGRVGSWKEDLSYAQQLVIWKYTRKLMRDCGYTFNFPLPW
jgi:hypothetical protein